MEYVRRRKPSSPIRSPVGASAWLFFFAAIWLPGVAGADVVWPELVLVGNTVTWWAIGAGLLAEWPAVRFLTKTTWLKSLGLVCLVNLASTLAGIVLIPVLGFPWTLLTDLVSKPLGCGGTFSACGWASAVAFAALVNVAIEWSVLRVTVKLKATWLVFGLLFAANLVSVGVAAATIFVSPPEGIATPFSVRPA